MWWGLVTSLYTLSVTLPCLAAILSMLKQDAKKECYSGIVEINSIYPNRKITEIFFHIHRISFTLLLACLLSYISLTIFISNLCYHVNPPLETHREIYIEHITKITIKTTTPKRCLHSPSPTSHLHTVHVLNMKQSAKPED